MSTAFNEENYLKRLENVQPTQESIQTLSLWIIHHKNNHELITKLWLKKLKESTSDSHPIAPYSILGSFECFLLKSNKPENSVDLVLFGQRYHSELQAQECKSVPGFVQILDFEWDRVHTVCCPCTAPEFRVLKF
jgi:hypothetical protein